MKTPRGRTILIVVLTVAGLGLVADRVVIGSDVTGPAQSSAGVVDGFDVGPAPLPTASASGQVESLNTDKAPAVSFAQRLRLITDSSADTDPGQARDAFTPGLGWEAIPSAPGAATDNQARRAAEAFQQTHRLDAVLITDDNRCAVIGGQTLFVGQMLDGYRLEAVHERSAVFEASGVRVEIGIRVGGPSS